MDRLNREKVLHIVGRNRLDDHTIAEVVRTGATEKDLIEAANRLMRGGDLSAENMRPMSPEVRKLCEILSVSLTDLSERD